MVLAKNWLRVLAPCSLIATSKRRAATSSRGNGSSESDVLVREGVPRGYQCTQNRFGR